MRNTVVTSSPRLAGVVGGVGLASNGGFLFSSCATHAHLFFVISSSSSSSLVLHVFLVIIIVLIIIAIILSGVFFDIPKPPLPTAKEPPETYPKNLKPTHVREFAPPHPIGKSSVNQRLDSS